MPRPLPRRGYTAAFWPAIAVAVYVTVFDRDFLFIMAVGGALAASWVGVKSFAGRYKSAPTPPANPAPPPRKGKRRGA